MTSPVLIGCGHGTRVPAGRRVMGQYRIDLAAARPGLEVRAAQVDVHKPALPDVVAALTAQQRPMVVVPLLLSTGYHVRVDIGAAVASAGGLAVAAAPLGPDPVLVDVLEERLRQAGALPGDPVVLAAAGSRDPQAADDVSSVARLLAERRGSPVTVGYLTASAPSVPEAVALARASSSRPVTIASYLLAPGHFSGRLVEAGADRITAPLAPHPALTRLALRRFDDALLGHARLDVPA
jgi:sirohydrochlorin ferrochelatase